MKLHLEVVVADITTLHVEAPRCSDRILDPWIGDPKHGLGVGWVVGEAGQRCRPA